MTKKCRTKKSSVSKRLSPSFSSYFFVLHFFVVCLVGARSSTAGADCPFCTALGPTLSQRRDEADIALLGEIERVAAGDWTVRVHHVLRGDAQLKGKTVAIPASSRDSRSPSASGLPAEVGSLLVAFGKREQVSPEQQPTDIDRWSCLTLNEASYGYVARLPDGKQPVDERLGYFAHYLEHADPLIAEDAYGQFALAPFSDLLVAADRLCFDSLRRWLGDARVPQARKGFYGLALAVAGGEPRRANAANELWRAIIEPADDFRAGFDGLVGGYLLAAGTPGLERIERRFLDDRPARPGDARHVMAALRFYHEDALAAIEDGIAAERIERAYRRLLDRPELAAAAVVDLARWEAWDALAEVVALFGRPGYDDPAIERAVFGFLLSAPSPTARRELRRLKAIAPQRCAEAEQMRLLTSGAR